MTHQRMEIFRELATACDHPSAEILHQRLKTKMPTLSLDTIYRTLATLEQCGLVKRVQTLESQAHFEVTTPSHHHLICERCGRINDFAWEYFDRVSLPEEVLGWGEINQRTVTLSGVCKNCRALANGEKKDL